MHAERLSDREIAVYKATACVLMFVISVHNCQDDRVIASEPFLSASLVKLANFRMTQPIVRFACCTNAQSVSTYILSDYQLASFGFYSAQTFR